MGDEAEALRPPPRVAAPARPWRILLIAVCAQFGLSVLDQGVPLLTGFIKADLGVSATIAGLVVSAFAVGKIVGAYLAGLAADAVGERLVIVVGGFAAALAVWLLVPAPMPLVVVLLAAAGAASATSTPAGGRLVLHAFPRERVGVALGIRQAGIPLGALVAAALLPWIAHHAGWRWSLAVAGAFAASLVIPVARAAVVPRTTLPPRPALRSGVNRDVALLTLWNSLFVTGQYAILAFLALDLHASGGLTLAEASLLVVVAQATGIVGRLMWGAISDSTLRRGRRWVLLIITGLGVASAVVLVATPRSAPLWTFVGVVALAGVALVGYQGHWVTMVAEAAAPDRVGAATGFAITFVLVAIALSTPLFGLVADATGTYRAIWLVLAGILALAFAPAILIRERE